MFGDLRCDQDTQMLLQTQVRSLLVHAGQPAVASNIGGENGSEPSLYALCAHAGLSPGSEAVYAPSKAVASGRRRSKADNVGTRSNARIHRRSRRILAERRA